MMQYNLQLWDHDTPAEAVDFIRESTGNGTAFVGFSGGKDSIVTAELMRMSGVKYELYYSFTGIDAPEVIRFIRKYYPGCKFLMPKRTFWRELSVNTPPSDRFRWCCKLLKKMPSYPLSHTQRFFGIRAEESTRRASTGRSKTFFIDGQHKKTGRFFYQFFPIYYWKEWQIWDFIHDNNLPYPVLYDWGFDRIGCVICPFHSEKTGKLHAKYREHWPKYFDRFEKGITDLFTKRQRQGKKMFYPTAGEFLSAWYLDDTAWWYHPTNENQTIKAKL